VISVDQALAIVLERVQELPVERVPLNLALDRVLAQDVLADINLPPFDRARMDGYAVLSEDVRTAPTTLTVVGEVPAGATFDRPLSRGEAVKIFTGAPLPPNADAVQKVEVTSTHGSTVTIDEAVSPGLFVTPRASEVREGEVVAKRGRSIGAAEMAVLASFGYDSVKVAARPRVAVISTGSELVEVSSKPIGSQIRNSNSYTIGSYAKMAGAIVDTLDAVEDTLPATREALSRAAEEHDVVISSGGVSMGDYDLVKASLIEIGAEVFFDKVSIRPGKPTVFGRRDRTYFFGLPGNPVSTSVTFNVFARPAIRKMQGAQPHLATFTARLNRALKDSSSRRSYLPGRLFVDSSSAVVEPLKWGGSSDLVAFMVANSLIIVPEEVHQLAEGDEVDVLVIGEIG
jgi:molybdopterin molybdotransferase